MSRQLWTLGLDDATAMVEAALARARSLDVPYCVAVVDAGGHLVAFARQNDARIGSIDLAINKAITARYVNLTTAELSVFAQPGAAFYGIQQSNGGKIVIFAGGMPVVLAGSVIGAIGVSAGTLDQDLEVAAAGLAALPE